MPNNQKALPGLIPKPYWGMKTSVIDMALTPELLEHILQTTKRENTTMEMRDDKSGMST
jgi:hypothetical protein